MFYGTPEQRPAGDRIIPVINLNKCEGNGICTHVCLLNVFRTDRISAEQFGTLSFIGKLKSLFSDNRKCFAVNPDLCINCGLCVTACPENAIKLIQMQ